MFIRREERITGRVKKTGSEDLPLRARFALRGQVGVCELENSGWRIREFGTIREARETRFEERAPAVKIEFKDVVKQNILISGDLPCV